MATAYVLLLEDAVLGPALELLRRVCQPGSRSKPHITVRYPVRIVDTRDVAAYNTTLISEIDVAEAGAFGLETSDGERCAIYLRCESDVLEALSYKPAFPDSVFHLTLYEGTDLEFGTELLRALQSFNWGLRVELPGTTRLTQIPIGRGSRAKREWATDVASMQRISEAAGIGLNAGDLDDVVHWDLARRLGVVRQVCVFLHESLPATDRTSDGRVGTLVQLPERAHQMSIFPPETQTAMPVDGRPLWGAETSSMVWSSGVFLTPPELAGELVDLALKHVDMDSKVEFGDPAVGSGILFAVLMERLNGRELTAATGIELNGERARLTSRRWEKRGLSVLAGDFLSAEATERWSLLLANPPYVRSQDIDPESAKKWRTEIESRVGIRLSGRASLYVYFVLMADQWMAKDAIAAWLLPADFMETGYGAELREYFTTRVQLLHVHTFDTSAPRFENALVSSSAILFRNRAPKDQDKVVLSYGSRIDQPDLEETHSVGTLRHVPKWRLLLSADLRACASDESRVSIGDLFQVRRGIATGANKHFVIDEQIRSKYVIPDQALVPILPPSRGMPASGVVDAGPDGLPVLDSRLWLIDSQMHLAEIERNYPSFYGYLMSVRRDVGTRALVARRKPFYRQEQRPPPMIVASNMGKLSRVGGAPVRFYLNRSKATVLNNYIALYPRPRLTKALELRDVTVEEVFAALGAIDPMEFQIFGRRYGGGLFKLEPGDLARVRFSPESASQYSLSALAEFKNHP